MGSKFGTSAFLKDLSKRIEQHLRAGGKLSLSSKIKQIYRESSMAWAKKLKVDG